MSQKKAIFFGSFKLGLDCFKYLLEYPPVRLVGLFVNQSEIDRSTDEMLGLAHKHSIPVLENFDGIMQLKPDIGFSVHYLRIISLPVINCFTSGIVNLHPGPLPEYRGSYPFIHAICDGKKEYGSSIHFINEYIDEGPIIKKNRCVIDDTMNAMELLERVRGLLYSDFKEILPNVLNGSCGLEYQADLIKANGIKPITYTRAMMQQRRKVDLTWPQKKIYNYIRAFQFPGVEPAYCIIEGKTVHLKINL